MARRRATYGDLESEPPAKADWELDIEHELKLVQCTECTHMANWTRTYTYVEDQVDVFTCRSCGHEMHIHHAEVDQVASE